MGPAGAALGAAEGKEIYWHVFRLILDQSYCIASELPPMLTRLNLDGLVVDQLCCADRLPTNA